MIIRELITRFGFDVEENKLDKLDANIGRLTVGLTAAGAAMLAIPVMLVRATGETQAALAEISSLGVKDLEALDNAAREFTNNFAGTTKDQFVRAAYTIRSALSGISEEAVGEFTALAGVTAKGTKSTIDQMVNVFAQGYGAFKSLMAEASDEEFANVFAGGLATTVKAYRTDGKQMADAISSLGAIASAANVPLAEQLAILGTLQTVTKGGAEAGTQFKAFVNNAARAGKQLDLEFVNPATGRLRSILEILDLIRKRFPDLSQAAAAVELKEAFGTDEAVNAINALMANMSSLETGMGQIETAMGNGSATAYEMADAINQGPNAASALFFQRLANLREELGKPLIPWWNRLFSGAGDFLVTLQELAKANPAVTIAANGVLAVGGAVLTLVGALAGLGFVAGPFQAALALFGVSISGFLTWVLLVPIAIAAIGTAIALVVEDIWNWVDGNNSAIGLIMGDYDKLEAKVTSVIDSIIAKLRSAMATMLDFLGLSDSIEKADARSEAARSAADGLSSVARNAALMSLGQRGAMTPEEVAAGMATSTSMTAAQPNVNQNLNATINVTVPPGSTEEQVRVVESAAQRVFDQSAFQDWLTQAKPDFARAE